MNFKKLKQLSNDIDLLEQSGKYSAAEVLHKKFIKEAQTVNNIQNYQARPGTVNQRTVYPGQGNAFEKGDNFARSERGGVGTLYNFQGLPPEMEPVRVQTSPGNYTTVMRPKNNIGNPYATRPSDPFRNIPGYNEFLSLRPSQSQIRDFVEARGTTTDAGMAIYNDLSPQKGSKSLSLAPSTQTQSISAPATPAASTPTIDSNYQGYQTPTTQTTVGKTPTIDPNYQGYQTPTTTNAPVQQAPSQPGTQPQGSSIPKLQERIDHYNKKIQEYKNVTDPKRKSEMLLYLSQYIENNYDQGLLDSQSYKNLMTALGEKGLS
jgi:hypothetical protein